MVDEDYLKGGLAFLSKGLSSLFCILRENEAESRKYVEQEVIAAGDLAKFNEYFNSTDEVKSTPVYKEAFDSSTASSDVYPGGSITLRKEGETDSVNNWWFVPDATGMCSATTPKFSFNHNETMKCLAKSTDTGFDFCADGTNSYQIDGFSSAFTPERNGPTTGKAKNVYLLIENRCPCC
eukprot:TRINITY_DN10656_c0_g1_i5.p1 TRINITY_DN10656_c0_g1~~TRINITY_DN10656_c0_g1_i5.p1  ORF type:complete len:180 (+),score=30.18 TRINITY_DN10656_c0_g1_i5:380-919(+)